jgi:hypothetical protein
VTTALNRRAFLTTGAIATVAVAVAGARPASAADELAVYRLSADWGYPVGPNNKTRCTCRACFRRADNAYFATREAALAGRIHPCCVCQPYATTVPGVAGDDLFLGGDSADRRDPRVAAVFQSITVPADTTSLGTDAASPASDPAGSMSFARTGSSLGLAGVGAGALTIGAALLALRSRRSPSPPADSKSQPTIKEPS